MTADRRLAAILVADVVGYTRLMEADEAGTLAALKERRKTILEPLVREHGGRIVKFMGDGVLVEFGSAVKAVEAALELQKRSAEANETLAGDRHIVLRIGINLGDVIGEGGDIYGEGVNIAARLEPLAGPGGVCISAKVYDEVRGKIEASFEDIGEQRLKNVSQPVRAFRAGGSPPPTERPAAGDTRPSIAVLPFTNMSGDPARQHFSDGFTEDVITELSRFRQLLVLARNSSFRYRGPDLDMLRVGRELGVSYLVEGSVRPMGERIRITAQLIDAATGNHLWAERYDGTAQEIYEMQDQAVSKIVATLVGRVQAAGAELARRKPPANLAAYECVAHGDSLAVVNAETRAEARRLFERAIALDPRYARAHALMAVNLNVEWESDFAAPESLLNRALEFARKAVELDDNDSLCHQILGLIQVNLRSFDQAEHHYQRALMLNPNRSALLAGSGYLKSRLGLPKEGIALLEQARVIDPFFQPSWYWMTLAGAYYNARQYAEAISALGHSSGTWPWKHALHAACLAQLGRDKDAQGEMAKAMALGAHLKVSVILTREPFKLDEDRQHLAEGLHKAGMPE